MQRKTAEANEVRAGQWWLWTIVAPEAGTKQEAGGTEDADTMYQQFLYGTSGWSMVVDGDGTVYKCRASAADAIHSDTQTGEEEGGM